MDVLQTIVNRKPGWVVSIWLVIAAAVGCLSPNLTKLAAEGQAKMLASDAESRRAADLVKQSWPDEAYEAMAVAVLHRPSGLVDADRQFALRWRRGFLAWDDLVRSFASLGRRRCRKSLSDW